MVIFSKNLLPANNMMISLCYVGHFVEDCLPQKTEYQSREHNHHDALFQSHENDQYVYDGFQNVLIHNVRYAQSQ
jgi:hypothetical protein